MKEKISNLEHGQSYVITKDGVEIAEIWRIHKKYFLFENSKLFCEYPTFIDSFHIGSEDEIIEEINGWE